MKRVYYFLENLILISFLCTTFITFLAISMIPVFGDIGLPYCEPVPFEIRLTFSLIVISSIIISLILTMRNVRLLHLGFEKFGKLGLVFTAFMSFTITIDFILLALTMLNIKYLPYFLDFILVTVIIGLILALIMVSKEEKKEK